MASCNTCLEWWWQRWISSPVWFTVEWPGKGIRLWCTWVPTLLWSYLVFFRHIWKQQPHNTEFGPGKVVSIDHESALLRSLQLFQSDSEKWSRRLDSTQLFLISDPLLLLSFLHSTASTLLPSCSLECQGWSSTSAIACHVASIFSSGFHADIFLSLLWQHHCTNSSSWPSIKGQTPSDIPLPALSFFSI